MKRLYPFLFILLLAPAAHSFHRTPDELVEQYYRAREFMNRTKILVLAGIDGENKITETGKKGLNRQIVSYTIQEIRTRNLKTAYALVEVKDRSVEEGLTRTREYWKMVKVDGIWRIDNIFFPKPSFIHNNMNPSWTLDRIVEKLIELEGSTYEKEEVVVEGTPLQKAVGYYQLGYYGRALYWIDVFINDNTDSSFNLGLGYLLKGLMQTGIGRTKEGYANIYLSFLLDSRMKDVFQMLTSGSGGASAEIQTHTEKKSYMINIDKLFSR